MAGRKKGGQPGNRNAISKKPWQAAIDRALAKRTLSSKRDALDELAEKLLVACDELDVPALRELGDRLDGKVVQQLETSGPGGGPIQIQQIEVVIVDPPDAGS